MFKNQQGYQEKVSQMISWGHWFTLFNILIILPLASRYLFDSDWPRTLAGRIYALVSLLGHFSFIPFAVYLLILFPLTFIIRSQRAMRVISAIIATAGITLLIIDAEIFSRFRLHLNPTVWQLVINPEEVELSRDWQVLFIAIPIIFLVQLLFGTWCWQKLRSLGKRSYLAKPLVIIFILSFICSHLTHIWADANFYRPITMQRANYPLSYPLTARKFLEKHGLLDKQSYENQLTQEGRPEAIAVEYPLGDITFSDKGANYNLLLIVVDGIHVGSLAQTMPELNRFAEQNLRFNQHFSTGNQQDTGLMGLFYGISPTYLDGVLSWRKSSAFIDALNQQGYKFSFLSANGFNSPLYRQALFTDYALPDRAKQSNDQITQQWQQWIGWQTQNDNSRWFSYINYSNDSVEKMSQTQQSYVSQYNQDSAEIDKEISDVIQSLANNNMLDNTIIIITANYGVEFNETGHGSWGAGQNFSRYQLQVPLIVHWPNKGPQVINKLTSHEDIMATLMQDLLHVQNPSSIYTQGENLFNRQRKYHWVSAGNSRELVITTADQTIILKANGSYAVYDKNYQQLKDEKPNLTLLLQVLTDIKRFIAN
jgi:membrane-anchored protein YejM (alkaline phosphatase superfamily)